MPQRKIKNRQIYSLDLCQRCLVWLSPGQTSSISDLLVMSRIRHGLSPRTSFIWLTSPSYPSRPPHIPVFSRA
ncbi:hypothetical protein BgiBS90_013292, partial [Biomphalaria glabrata]